MRDQLAERIAHLMPRAQSDLADLVAIPSIADPRSYPPEDCRRAAEWVRDAFAEVGFRDLRLAETSDGSLAVLGERPGPAGAPTVLLYSHYDVQPPMDEAAWDSPPFTLTEREGRWYGRGAADCKGNILTQLTALRAWGEDVPVHLKLVCEGSEEQGTGGLEDYLHDHPEELRADVVLVCDTGNATAGVPSVTVGLRGVTEVVVRVNTLASAAHSGMFGGAAPDALAALIHMLATLRDDKGQTAVRGLDQEGSWPGRDYPVEQFRRDARVLEGVGLFGAGDAGVADLLWARPALTVLGIDCPPVVGSAAAVQPAAAARLSLRVPPGTDPVRAQDALVGHLEQVAPWGVRLEIERGPANSPFLAATGGPAYTALADAMQEAFGHELALLGGGGSIPLCNALAEQFPKAEIMLLGVEEPASLIHAPNESVDPGEISRMALAIALFLGRLGRP
ncbi:MULTISPECIES: dipeptidase [Streptomyces]|uniref:Dipeptidase n=1 Tax=Streptomyces spororaveus TaxID=284039 RepID=A0ABQ3T8M8_9ACTN|nr:MULTISPECIES: dipeptidase [Streptomyces]MCM9082822.1 dipeptidase [Streptomyces spororaveus]MCX5302409.1 dipeptidase [Streptomyces sp. NBC_00160]GHI76749.1 dipeptidase [Streptomyces spororaveus]